MSYSRKQLAVQYIYSQNNSAPFWLWDCTVHNYHRDCHLHNVGSRSQGQIIFSHINNCWINCPHTGTVVQA